MNEQSIGAVIDAPKIIDNRDAWLEARRTSVTATDAAAVMGVHPYKTPREVYLDKKGLLPEVQDNRFMEWGRTLEPVIGKKWSENNGLPIVQGDFTRHPKEPYFAATPDFLVGDDAVLEVKTAGHFAGENFGESGTDAVPTQYLVQVLWQCFVTGRTKWHLAVLIGGNDYREFKGVADSDLIQRMAHLCRKFWHEYILSDCPPPLTGHERDTNLVTKQHPEDDGSEVVATWELEEIIAELGHLRAELQDKELRRTQLENQIKEFMGDATKLRSQEGFFTWKASGRKVVNWKEIAKHVGQEFIEANTTLVPTRTFRTPWKSDRA
jgi:putative phage-type endonuclease